MGLAAVALLERGGGRGYLAWALVGLTAACSAAGWRERMLRLQRQNAYRRPAWFVRLAGPLTDSTRPGDIILGFGMSANPEVPYYAKRRALMWPDWADPSPDDDDVGSALDRPRGPPRRRALHLPPRRSRGDAGAVS